MEALLPVLGLLAAGGAVMFLVSRKKRKEEKELPTDLLADYFIGKDESV